MNEEKMLYIKQWLEKAKDDLRVYDILMKDENPVLSIAGFHLQQSAEKYLKAYLEYMSVPFAKTHDIEYLLELCASLNALFAQINFVNLTDYAVDMRYPGFMQTPTKNELEQDYISVHEIKRIPTATSIFFSGMIVPT
ncbi:MAG TPA: HEPN domain-containing protein, partial [Bacteroidales bacterium]|nr:HEPN domain-containing protein [Bacteroidales bacterium]HQN17387.1 HEPN domain-containing protein [Bacteroidales bacterium]